MGQRPTENEMTLKYINELIEETVLWMSSKQKDRIPPSVDKTAAMITAYWYGVIDGREGRS